MSEDVRRIVGRNVRRLRTAAGLSQAELADKIGVDRAYVSGLELGERNATILTLWHVAQALDVKVGRLFKEVRARTAVAARARGRRTALLAGRAALPAGGAAGRAALEAPEVGLNDR